MYLCRGKQFKPSVDILSRIMNVLLVENSIAKTKLAQKANVNYARFLQHLEWLDDRLLVKFIVIGRGGRKVNVTLTEKGRAFALMLVK